MTRPRIHVTDGTAEAGRTRSLGITEKGIDRDSHPPHARPGAARITVGADGT